MPLYPASTRPGGSANQLQYNDGTTFAGTSDLTWDKTTSVLTLGGGMTASGGGFVVKGATGQIFVWSGGQIGFSNASTVAQSSSADTVMVRDGAANTLALRNGTAAQTFNVYNTFTDASNYERGCVRFSGNVFQIGTEAGGTGTVRAISLRTGGSERLNISASGIVTGAGIDVISNGGITFASGYELRVNNALRMSTPADGILRLMSWGNTAGAAIESVELAADPSAPAANSGRIYFRDNGSGKTQMCVRFATGAAQVLATEP